MRIAYLDCFSGISGDMFLGALVDAGVPPKLFEETVAALNIGARLESVRVMRGGISAMKVDVYVDGQKDLPREVFLQQKEASEGRSSHTHSHSHPHSHDHSAAHAHPHDQSPSSDSDQGNADQVHIHGRGLAEIKAIIQQSAISLGAKSVAIKIFEALGEAEAEIHGTSLNEVHFHEVGAVDAMVDIICAAVGAEALAVDEWVCSPLNVGGGTVKCAHGTLPVPAPATIKLLSDAPVYSAGPAVELVTPTGAAIVKTLATRFASFPAMTVLKASYGAGTREFADHPNLLRLTLGEAAAAPGAETTSAASNDTIIVLEANLDDLSPQVVGYAMERLLAEGALDVFSVPVQMKKNRPGAVLTVLAKTEDADRLASLMFAETSTLGIRRREEQRQVLLRRWQTVETSWGPVRMKVANINGSISNYAPEYEDCRKLAREKQVPLRNVMQEAIQEYLRTTAKN
jgi:TIGR00299 family protein